MLQHVRCCVGLASGQLLSSCPLLLCVGFSTCSHNPFSSNHAPQEEVAKRAARAKKFGLPDERQAPGYAPDPEDAKREARAKKFGVKYEKPTPDTLLQKQGE
jgi:hypothetical protein